MASPPAQAPVQIEVDVCLSQLDSYTSFAHIQKTFSNSGYDTDARSENFVRLFHSY
jgi:hypothetical protein